MDTLNKVLTKFNIDLTNIEKLPIEIDNSGRVTLAELINDLNFKEGVEIGVRGGDYSKILCENNPQLRLYGVDPYIPHQGYNDIRREKTFNRYKQNAQDILYPYLINGQYEFIEMFSLDAVKRFKDESLDFVYIDGDHCFESVVLDIAYWSKKVKKGGIISGDDYFKHRNGKSHIHVYQAVRGYTDAWKIKPWFVLGSKAIVEGEIRDHGRSWFFVKQ